MNKNVVIAVLIALLVGIGIGVALNQAAQGGAGSEPATSVAASTSSTSTAQPAEKIEPQSSSAESNAPLPGEGPNALQGESTQGSPGGDDTASASSTSTSAAAVNVEEDGTYTSKEEVAAYIHEFGHLPSNYISKTKARKAGWVAKEGNLDEVLPGMSIGGSEFYNDEGQLPDAPGRTWTECDINYTGGYRGAERIVFSSDGLIFYTGDHYETFEQLY